MPLQRGTACLQCRRRKLKCDGQKPACNQCKKHARVDNCSYENPTSWGKHRLLHLQINDLQRQLESTLGQVKYLTAALHSHYKPSDTPPMEQEATSSQSSVSIHSSSLELEATPARLNTDMLTVPLLDYVQPDMLGNDYVTPPQTNPTEIAAEFQLSIPPPSYFQLKVTTESQEALLQAFFPHTEQFHLDLTVNQVMTRVEGPYHSLPHDALLHAMFLIGCRFDGLNLSPQHEVRFRQRVQRALKLRITCQSDRKDCIRAACLLAGYFYATDCLSEAREHVKVASSLARSMSLESPLGYVSLEETMILQQVYTTDRLIAAYLGAAELFSGELLEDPAMTLDVTLTSFQIRLDLISSWTVTLEACLAPGPSKSSYTQSETELLDRKAFNALRSRAADLVWIASLSMAIFVEPSSSQTYEPETLDSMGIDMVGIIGRIRGCLPAFQLQGGMEPHILGLHTLVYASLLQILRRELLCPRDVCDGLVGELNALIRELWDHDYKYLEPIMGLCWQWLVEHLLDKAHQQHEHTGQLDDLIRSTLLAMNKLASELPVVSVNLANVAVRCNEWGIPFTT